MNQKHRIKKTLIWNGFNIQLFESENVSRIPYNSVSNIIAIDSVGNLIWKAETPKSHYEEYYDISIDSSKNFLIATTGSGYRHLINLENGKIVDYYLVK